MSKNIFGRNDHSRYYTVEWEMADKKFVNIREKNNKYELNHTGEEKVKIGRFEGKCAKYMAQDDKEDVFNKLRTSAELSSRPTIYLN